ncbi:FAD-dependent monooxygenase [Baekduia alba]|uniref:FAD-dependent monooxygenase n=1 Tax=Baekduia alba TaxID=2997333 RepID=UPI0023402EB9|nr:FAD-dependent monooxygenase [Baekduia alba]
MPPTAASHAPTVAIVGGGIGGLTAALALLRAGIRPHVYEQSPAFGEVGAGIQLAPNAVRLLDRLGFAEELRDRAVRPARAIEYRRWSDGRLLGFQSSDLEHEERYGASYVVIHRAHLLELLLAALPKDLLHAGHRCVGVEQTEGGARVLFEEGTAVEADLVVAADGLRSVVRESVASGHGPAFAGFCAYRALLPIERAPLGDAARSVGIWLGPGRHFVHYPVAGGGLMNVVGLVAFDDWPHGFQPQHVSAAEFAERFAGWHPDVRATIDVLTDVTLWGLFAGTPLPSWTSGRVVLLGDVAHPMLPFAAQGACQAIEDAVALGACLGRAPGDIDGALARYEHVRIPRASAVQAHARENATAYNLPDGAEQQRRDAELARGDGGAWLYGYDVEAAVAEAALAAGS